MDIYRGELYYANLGDNNSTSVQSGIRPALIISNDKGNKYSQTVIVAPLTSKIKRIDLPIHIPLTVDDENGLELNSVVLLEQLRTLDKSQILHKIGKICSKDLEGINKALKISLNLV